MTATGGGTSWQQYFQQLHVYLKWQTDQIRAMQQTIASLQKELADIKEQKGVRIDRIEYSFDQLKVERLEGTLNIGVTPAGVKSIQEFAVNADGMGGIGGTDGTNGVDGMSGGTNGGQQSGQNQPDWMRQVGQNVHDYLSHEAMTDIGQLAEKYNVPLDKDMQRFVIEDIRKQIDDRIRFYTKQTGNRATTNGIEDLKREIIEKTKRDIRIAMDQYVNGLLQQKEGEA
jgi:hypothetical protein